MKPLLKKTKVEKVNTEICNLRSANYLKAFTIIELLFVITIIALLFGGGIGGYLGLQKRTAIDQAAMNLKKDIEYMKHAALLNRSDSNDQRWVSAFAIRIYKDGDVYKYRKYKFCSNSVGFNTFPNGVFYATSIKNSKTICNADNEFVSFEKNEEYIIDKRVGNIDSPIYSGDIEFIIFETITGNVNFYQRFSPASSTFVEISPTSSPLKIKLCSADNKARRQINVDKFSRIQFNYLTVDYCN